MNRALAALTVPILALALLAGCSEEEQSAPKAEATVSSSPSGGPSSSGPSVDPDAPGADTEYCRLLATDFATVFASIQGPEDVEKAVGMIRDIVDAAPADVADEWQTMAGALDEMEGALTKAAELQQKAAAGKISQKELQKQSMKLQQDMQALNTPENNKAGKAVSEHAAEYCGVQLGQ